MIGRAIVEVAFYLHASPRYRHLKKFFYNLLENPNYPYKRFFDYMMMMLIAISVYILIRHVKHEISPFWLFFNNYVISFIFLVEYLLRLWVYSDTTKIIIDQYEHDLFLQRRFRIGSMFRQILVNKSGYVFSPSAIIDFLAIMPFFHELRMLRIFILFRVFKLFRYSRNLMQLLSILSSKKFEIITLGLFAAVIILVSSVLIYVMEANNPESPIDTLFDAVYWSVVTIFTVGYGDFVPVTEEGRTVAMVIIVAGIAVISFATSIVVSAFTEKLDEIKEDKLVESVGKLNRYYLVCGYSHLTEEVVTHLIKNKKNVVIIDADKEKIEEAQKKGFIALALDPSSLNTYRILRVDWEKQIKAVILLHQSDVLNVYTALTIREMTASVQILSTLVQQENRRKLGMAGIDEIVYTQELIGLMSKEVSGRPVAFEVIHALRSENSGVFIEEIPIGEESKKRFFETAYLPLFGKRLIVLGIYQQVRREFIFNPASSLKLYEGDVAIVIGTRALIDEFKVLIYQRGK